MLEKTRATLLHSSNLYGSERYALTVEVINLTEKPLSDIKVKSQFTPGRILSLQEDPSYSETSKLDYERQSIIKELNLQIIEAYIISESLEKGANTKELNKTSPQSFKLLPRETVKISTPLFEMSTVEDLETPTPKSTSFWKDVKRILQTEVKVERVHVPLLFTWELSDDLSLKEKLENRLPIWAKEATKISKWDDVESLEELIISRIPDELFLKKAFLANKSKLKALNEQAQSYDGQSRKSLTLQPGQIVSFTFYCQAPNLLHQRTYDCQFEISYLEGDDSQGHGVIGIQTLRKPLIFYASSYAPASGVILGGICGFLVKTTFLSSTSLFNLVTTQFIDGFLAPLIGTILLSWILSVAIRRSDDSRKFLTVEDFSGGFFIGSIAGLFSEQILDYLRTVLPGEKGAGKAK